MGKVFVTGIIWIVCSILSFNSYSILFYYSQIVFLIISVVQLILHRKELYQIIKFRADKKDYNNSVIEFYSKNLTKLFGILIVIIAIFFHSADILLRNEFSSMIVGSLAKEDMKDSRIGMIWMNSFHYKDGIAKLRFRVTVFNKDESKVLNYDLKDFKGEWVSND